MALRILSGIWKGQSLVTLKVDSTRPTTSQLRQAVFNIWATEVSGAHMLDLFAGTGAMGLEALSLGAEHVTFVEADIRSTKNIVQNIDRFGCVNQTRVWSSKAELFLKKTVKKFDLIYVDPPYDFLISNDCKSGIERGQYVMFFAKSCLGHLKSGAQLIIEQGRHAKELVYSLETLQHLDTRTYGDSMIHRFQRL